jgi:hypothetical protein
MGKIVVSDNVTLDGVIQDPDRLNSLPKYVVSSTLEHPAWNNSTVLRGEVLNQVSTLKQQADGDIVVPAGCSQSSDRPYAARSSSV